MAKLGWYVFLFGIGALILNLFDFDVLNWVDQWSTSAGWTMRFAVVIAGLYLMEHAREKDEVSVRAAEDFAPVAHSVV